MKLLPAVATVMLLVSSPVLAMGGPMQFPNLTWPQNPTPETTQGCFGTTSIQAGVCAQK
jgi:hypothetical protein